MRPLATTKSLIINHEWTRMHTNVHDESTEYKEETECLADGPIAAEGGAYGRWPMAYGLMR